MSKRSKLPRRKSKRISSLTKYVVFSLSMVIIYTIVVTILTTYTSYDYSSLYAVFCGIFGGEVLCSALIKIFKMKDDNTDSNSFDN